MDAAEVECLCTKILENIRTNDGKNADLLICDSKNIEQYNKKRNMRNIILKPRLLHMERK